jgi:class 3 adenylate cyclase
LSAESESERRLAAIVAVDMAGYSRRAEADQAGAVQAVASLAQAVERVAAAHGGRVFNTAGDGFMLEFLTASGALEAAADLAGQAPVPVRIGVHLGDVHVTPGGDLLGHGVNVAARLQALADPGAILVSDDVRRVARGPLADQLKPQGRERLDKMGETARIYALGKGMRRSRPRLLWAGLGAAAMVLVATGLWAVRGAMAPPSPELTTAVRDFTVEGSGLESRFGVSMADSVAAGLGARHAPTVSRDRVRRGDMAGARLLVGGEVVHDGANLRLHAHIDDAKAGLILWSADFLRPADQTDALQDTTATKIADLVDLVRRDAAAAGQAALTSDTLAALLHAEDIGRLAFKESPDEKRTAWRRVIALAPRFSTGHSNLALFDLNDLRLVPEEMRGPRRIEAKAEVDTALKLNPRDPVAFIAASLLTPKGDVAAREDWLTRGLMATPDYAPLNTREADLQGQVGRLAGALALHQKALEEDPLSRSAAEGVVFALIGVGRIADARALNQRTRRGWADYDTAQTAELTTDLLYGDQASGKAALDAADRGELGLTGQEIAAFRQVLAARAGKLPAAMAGRAVVQAAREHDQMDLGLELGILVTIDQIDLAYGELDRRLPANPKFFFATLYHPAFAKFRNDPRFMPLAARLGTTHYWLTTGRWPDFCAAADLPYSCEAAAKAAEANAAPAP